MTNFFSSADGRQLKGRWYWNIDTPESFEEGDYVIISSSRQDQIHRQGVALILNKNIANSMINYNVISERIVSIEIDTTKGPLTIFQIYAPDCNYSDNDIDIFYDQIQNEINKLSRRHKYLILGDLNAKVGANCHKNWPTVAGKFSIGTTNDRG